jgi:hypothetical protein
LTYYHVVIWKKGDEGNRDLSFIFNLSIAEVGEEVVIPIANQQVINCKGQVIQPNEISSYRIVETEEKASDALKKEKKKQGYLRKTGTFIAEKSPKLHSDQWIIIESGKNVTSLLKKRFVRKYEEPAIIGNDWKPNKVSQTPEFYQKKFDVFICYKRSSAEDIAIKLREALKEHEISAFIDTIDIPKEYELTEKWWQFRDQAIRTCGTFLMLVTIGFEKSTEIVKEIRIARDSKRKFALFRWIKLSTDLQIDLGDEVLNIKDLQQTPFDSAGMLIRQFFDNCSKEFYKKQKHGTIPKQKINTDQPLTPLVHYGITQQINETPLQWDLPRVGFIIRSWHPDPIRARVKAKVILGGEDLGMEKGCYRNGKYLGYYNGKTTWNLNPYGAVFGNFTLPEKCATSKEALTIEVKVVLKDQKGNLFRYLPVAFTYMRDKNTWFYEPVSF